MSETRINGRRYFDKVCKHCGGAFRHRKRAALYCSQRCAVDGRDLISAEIERRYQLALALIRRRRTVVLDATRGLGVWGV